MVIALVLSLLSGISLPSYALPSGNWLDGIAATTDTWDAGGTIGSAADLAQFCYNVNHGKSYAGQTITLTAYIDLSEKYWTPIGTTTYKFNGTFNGQGHAVGNMSIASKFGRTPVWQHQWRKPFKIFRQRQYNIGSIATAGIAAWATDNHSTIENCRSMWTST